MFVILTDSTAYFTKEEAYSLGIIIIPMTYTIGAHRYSEHYAEQNEDFLSIINQNLEICKTSQPNLLSYENAFKRVVDAGTSGLCISISSRLSGACSSAEIAAKNVSQSRIKVVDSKSVAGGLRLVVEEALKMRASGFSFEETYKECNRITDNVGVTFSVENMDALRRSGRIGAVKQSISNILNIKPILALKDGAVLSVGTARGLNNLSKAMCDSIPIGAKKIIINSFLDSKNLSILAQMIKERTGIVPIINLYGGPILAIHLGQEAFGVAWQIE